MNNLIEAEKIIKPELDKITMGDAEEYFEDLGLEYNVDYKDVVLIVSLALIISCLATIYPARKAAKLKPAEILRYA